MAVRNDYRSIDEIVLSCINKTRPMTSSELWQRYQQACRRLNVLPLLGQCQKAVTRILQNRLAVYDPSSKTIRKVDRVS